MTSQPGKQTIEVNIVQQLEKKRQSGNKVWSVNEMCNVRNIFLGKSYTKCDGETISRLFSKSSKLSISLDLYSRVL